MSESLHDHSTGTALEMAIVSESNNKATAQLNVDFYAFKMASGKELDTNEVADKTFWERNLVKIEEKLAFLQSKLPEEV
jgi:hypothetical protein